MEIKENLKKVDFEIFSAIEKETKRQREHVELIASENFVSEAVLEAIGSTPTNKYSEGYPAKRYYAGCEHIDTIETLAIERLKKLFNAEHANVQPHSGSNANLIVYSALLKPGDKVMGMNLDEGGHLSHGSPVNFSGKFYNFTSYGLNPETERIDYDACYKLAKEVKPKLIVAGASAYPRKIDFSKFREIADAVGAYLMVDMAHIAGLVAAGFHMNPCPYADFVTSTTHKTLRGPRGGIILTNNENKKLLDKSVFPGFQGGPLENIIAAKAVCFKEALEPSFKVYIEQIIKNAQKMGDVLQEGGIRLVSGGTDNHLLLLDVRNLNLTGKEAEKLLSEVNITTNKNAIPNDPQKPMVTSGVRIGTPAITTRGMKENDVEKIALLMIDALKQKRDAQTIKAEVLEILKSFPLYEN